MGFTLCQLARSPASNDRRAALHRCETENGCCCRDAVPVRAPIDKRFAWLGFDHRLPVPVAHDLTAGAIYLLRAQSLSPKGTPELCRRKSFSGSEPISRVLRSVADRHQIIFAQELQFDPAFDREGVHGKPVLPKAKAHSQPVGGQL
jgi:hypothetical protein